MEIYIVQVSEGGQIIGVHSSGEEAAKQVMETKRAEVGCFYTVAKLDHFVTATLHLGEWRPVVK